MALALRGSKAGDLSPSSSPIQCTRGWKDEDEVSTRDEKTLCQERSVGFEINGLGKFTELDETRIYPDSRAEIQEFSVDLQVNASCPDFQG